MWGDPVKPLTYASILLLIVYIFLLAVHYAFYQGQVYAKNKSLEKLWSTLHKCTGVIFIASLFILLNVYLWGPRRIELIIIGCTLVLFILVLYALLRHFDKRAELIATSIRSQTHLPYLEQQYKKKKAERPINVTLVSLCLVSCLLILLPLWPIVIERIPTPVLKLIAFSLFLLGYVAFPWVLIFWSDFFNPGSSFDLSSSIKEKIGKSPIAGYSLIVVFLNLYLLGIPALFMILPLLDASFQIAHGWYVVFLLFVSKRP